MSLVVRSARPGDGDGLAQAARDLAEQFMRLDPDRFQLPADEAPAWYEAELRRPRTENEVWLVAELDGRVVGEAQAFVQEPVESAEFEPQRDVGRRRVYLNYLAVQAAHRSRGIGSHLMESVEEWARGRGAELLLTNTNLRSSDAVRFYEKCGFARQAVILRKPL